MRGDCINTVGINEPCVLVPVRYADDTDLIVSGYGRSDMGYYYIEFLPDYEGYYHSTRFKVTSEGYGKLSPDFNRRFNGKEINDYLNAYERRS